MSAVVLSKLPPLLRRELAMTFLGKGSEEVRLYRHDRRDSYSNMMTVVTSLMSALKKANYMMTLSLKVKQLRL